METPTIESEIGEDDDMKTIKLFLKLVLAEIARQVIKLLLNRKRKPKH